MIYPVLETKIIEQSLQLTDTNRLEKYLGWLKKVKVIVIIAMTIIV